MNPKRAGITEDELADYLDSRLSDAERRSFDVRLQADPQARKTADLVQSLRADPLPVQDVPERLVRNVIALYRDHRKSPGSVDLVLSLARKALSVLSAATEIELTALAPAPALRRTPRREASMIVATKKFETVTADVNIEKTCSGVCNIGVSVTESASRRPASSIRVELFGSSRLLGSHRLQHGRSPVRGDRAGPLRDRDTGAKSAGGQDHRPDHLISRPALKHAAGSAAKP